MNATPLALRALLVALIRIRRHSLSERLVALLVPFIAGGELDGAGVGAAGGGEPVARFFGLPDPIKDIRRIRRDARDPDHPRHLV